MASRYVRAALVCAGVVVPDQITKILVQQNMELWSSRPVIPGLLDVVHVINKGAAFGFLNRADVDWQRPFFLAVTLLALGFVGYLVHTASERNPLLVTGLGLVAGGAVGNFIDRVRLGVVVDFIDIYVGPHHWPAFNVADIAINLGALAILVSMYKTRGGAARKG